MGIRTTNIPREAAVTEVIGNYSEGGLDRTVRIRVSDLATQLASDGPLADAVSAVEGGFRVFASYANLWAALSPEQHSGAWVVGDAVAANNGIWRKSGAAGVAGWVRVADLPYSVIKAVDTGTGTGTEIHATSALPVSESALIYLVAAAPNTGSPVSIIFNGGPSYLIKTNGGGDPAVGGIPAAAVLVGMISGATFRLISDQASVAIQAAAESARDAAATSAATASAAAAAMAGGVVDGSVTTAKLAAGAATPTKLALGLWTTVAAASTLDLGAQTTRNLVLTAGTGMISSFGSTPTPDNVVFRLRIAGPVTIVRSPALETPTGASVVLVAGDCVEAVQESTGTWRLLSVVRASGINIGSAAALTAGPAAGNVVVRDAGGLVGLTGGGGGTGSGVAIDFVGIPATARRIRIVFDGVSSSGSATKGIQVLTSSGAHTTAYGSSVVWGGSSNSLTNMFGLPGVSAGDQIFGEMTLTLTGTNRWVMTWIGTILVQSTIASHGAGVVTASGPLTGVRLTTSNGTDTYDNGSIIVFWE